MAGYLESKILDLRLLFSCGGIGIVTPLFDFNQLENHGYSRQDKKKSHKCQNPAENYSMSAVVKI